jgi:hypothetical protein
MGFTLCFFPLWLAASCSSWLFAMSCWGEVSIVLFCTLQWLSLPSCLSRTDPWWVGSIGGGLLCHSYLSHGLEHFCPVRSFETFLFLLLNPAWIWVKVFWLLSGMIKKKKQNRFGEWWYLGDLALGLRWRSCDESCGGRGASYSALGQEPGCPVWVTVTQCGCLCLCSAVRACFWMTSGIKIPSKVNSSERLGKDGWAQAASPDLVHSLFSAQQWQSRKGGGGLLSHCAVL